MSFILDALRKSDAKRRSGSPPGIGQEPPPEAPRRRPGSRGRGIALGLAALLVLIAGGVAYLERDRIGEQIAAWTEPSGPGTDPGTDPGAETAPTEPEAATVGQPGPIVASDRSTSPSERAGPTDRSAGEAADYTDPATAMPRERIVSDPESIERELERLVAEQGAQGDEAAEESTSEPAPRASRRDRRTLQMPSNIVMAEPRDVEVQQREQEAREQEALAQMEARMAAARARREARAMAAERAREAARSEAAAAETNAAEAAEPAADPEPAESRPPDSPALARAATPVSPIEPEPEAQAWVPTAPEYVRVWELPLSVRRNLPELQLNIHVFAEEPRERFVLVNGERFRTGDSLADGVRLVEIRREGAIVDFRDYRFLLDP